MPPSYCLYLAYTQSLLGFLFANAMVLHRADSTRSLARLGCQGYTNHVLGARLLCPDEHCDCIVLGIFVLLLLPRDSMRMDSISLGSIED